MVGPMRPNASWCPSVLPLRNLPKYFAEYSGPSRTFRLFHAPSINTRNSFRTFSIIFRTPPIYYETFRITFGTSFLHILIYITQPKMLLSLKCVTRRVRIYTDMHRDKLSNAMSISGHLTHTIMLPEYHHEDLPII